MGNFVSVMTDEPALRLIVRSHEQAKVAEVLAKCPRLRGDVVPGRNLDAVLGCLPRLIDGDFTSDEQADGNFFIDLFYEICGAYAQHRTTQEIWFDDETFPEMWAFVWDARGTPFGLPLSPYGSPAVGYWDDAGVKRFIRTFGELDHAARWKTAGKNYAEEVGALLDVLRIADKERKGVYVFYFE